MLNQVYHNMTLLFDDGPMSKFRPSPGQERRGRDSVCCGGSYSFRRSFAIPTPSPHWQSVRSGTTRRIVFNQETGPRKIALDPCFTSVYCICVPSGVATALRRHASLLPLTATEPMEHLLPESPHTSHYGPWSPYHEHGLDYAGDSYMTPAHANHHVNGEQGNYQVCASASLEM
jgi:hypothetical protein